MTKLIRAKNWRSKGPNSNLPLSVRKAKEKASKKVKVVKPTKSKGVDVLHLEALQDRPVIRPLGPSRIAKVVAKRKVQK